MVLISHGCYIPLFKYNSKNNDCIIVNDFLIDKYPVTNLDFKLFTLENTEWTQNNVKSIFADVNYLFHWKDVEFNIISDKPVVNVSWFAANAYCSYMGGRLPTIDEWEYVSNASKNDPRGKGNPVYLKIVLDWYLSSQSKKILSCNNMTANYWRVYGIHGFIWEWVNDFNSVILLNTDAEGGGLEELLYCGASSTNAIDPTDYVAFMRFAFRNSLEANYTITTLGFRCAKNVK
jgi:formylglycine-generating enzyme required for sulfatase activity